MNDSLQFVQEVTTQVQSLKTIANLGVVLSLLLIGTIVWNIVGKKKRTL